MCDIKDALVLVIDDCEDNLLLMELILLQDGYEVEKASTGKEGIAKIHKFVPDLIILDIMMPDMTGFEVIEQIKPHQCLSHIPIIICTANKFVQKKNMQEAADVFYKPIDIGIMLAKINSLVACCDSITSPTLIIDVGDKDPLYRENQQLLFDFPDERLTLKALQSLGYEIY